MADYIDRETALNALCDNCDRVQAVCAHYPCKQYRNIDALPYTDAVEIVRCGECKHYELAKNGVNGICNRQYGSFNAYDFCSYGEKNDYNTGTF